MSKSQPLGIGDTCYDTHGQQAVLLAKSAGDYVVRVIYEDDDGEERLGDVQTWNAAFRTPPTPKLDAETKAAEERLAALRSEINKLTSERHQFDADHKARLERIKQHEGLEMLDRYLAGEITHYVAFHDYYPTVSIIPLGDTLRDYGSSSGYGLLTMMPSITWDKRVVFMVTYRSPYDRHSSKTDKVIPCCGEEQANAVAKALVSEKVEEYLGLKPERRSYIDHLFAACNAFGVPIPQSLIDEKRAGEKAALSEKAEKLRQELEATQQQLSAISA